MAELSARGYVNKPEARTSAGGKSYSRFTLSVKQKGRNGNPDTRALFGVTDFENSSPPPDGAYVTVTGYLTVNDTEKNGVKYRNLDVVAKTLEIAPPREGTAPAAAGAPAVTKDPWD